MRNMSLCFRAIGHGKVLIFNAHSDLSAYCAHRGETGTDNFPQMLTWAELKRGPSPCLRVKPTVRATFPPSPVQHANHLGEEKNNNFVWGLSLIHI